MSKLLGLVLFTILIIMVSCNSKKQDKHSKAESIPLTVEGQVIQTKPFSDQVILVADLLPLKIMEIKASISGILLEYHFKEGQQVKEGDLLIRLDDRRNRIQLEAMEAEHKLLLRELKRKKSLQEIEAISIEELERIQDRVIIIEAEVKLLQLAIEMANIKAPFEGKMGMMDWTEGSYINQGETITQLVQNRDLKVNLQIPGSYSDPVNIGDTLWIRANNDSAVARVYAISPVMDEYSRTLQVRAKFQPADHASFVPGAFVEVILPVNQKKDAIVVPAKSVLYDIDKQTVYILKQGKVQKKTVETGVVGSVEVEITKGLQAGDTLITSGLLKLKEGMLAHVIL